jgi:hypothetical protein
MCPATTTAMFAILFLKSMIISIKVRKRVTQILHICGVSASTSTNRSKNFLFLGRRILSLE